MTIDRASSDYSRELEAQIKHHLCYCGADLFVAWIHGQHVIRCGKGHINPELKRVKSYLELWKMGIPIDPHIEQVYARQEAQGKIKRKISKEELPF